MNSLKDVYSTLVEHDMSKVAAYNEAYNEAQGYVEVDEGLFKQAQDYDHIGRILAHNVFADMLKTAMDETSPEMTEEEKAKALMAMLAAAQGQTPPKEEEKKEESEKKASVRAAILSRMSEDPEYVSHLVSKYYGG